MKSTVFVMEQNVPMPKQKIIKGESKYDFMKDMSIGDSFIVQHGNNGYSVNGFVQQVYKVGRETDAKYAYRTLSGGTSNPTNWKVRIWRLR